MKLSDKLKAWRAERPDEWTMDEFIRDSNELEKLNEEMVDVFLEILYASLHSYKVSLRYLKEGTLDYWKQTWAKEIAMLEEIKKKPIEEILRGV